MSQNLIRGLLLASVACALGSSLGSCRDTSIVGFGDGGQDAGDAGRDGEPDAGDAGLDAGPDAGDAGLDGGEDAGDAGRGLDAGTCRIGDGGLVSAGTWQAIVSQSCVVCDPAQNADGWTVLDAGQPCAHLVSAQGSGSAMAAIPGACVSLDFPPFVSCGNEVGGFTCDDSAGPPCLGGFCNDAGWCEVDQDLGVATACGFGRHPNPCAQGPCCMDAGVDDIPDGGGWCCGLVDGGVHTCAASGEVCYDTSNCCEGLTCTGHDAVYGSDAGYGFCE